MKRGSWSNWAWLSPTETSKRSSAPSRTSPTGGMVSVCCSPRKPTPSARPSSTKSAWASGTRSVWCLTTAYGGLGYAGIEPKAFPAMLACYATSSRGRGGHTHAWTVQAEESGLAGARPSRPWLPPASGTRPWWTPWVSVISCLVMLPVRCFLIFIAQSPGTGIRQTRSSSAGKGSFPWNGRSMGSRAGIVPTMPISRPNSWRP